MKQINKILKTFNFSKEEAEQNDMILEMVYDLAINEVQPMDKEWDEEGATFDSATKTPHYPKGMMDLYKKAQENDLFGLIVPEKYDGFGLSYTLHCSLIELMARASLAFSMFFPSQGLNIEIIKNFGTEYAKDKYLPELGSGKRIGAMALAAKRRGNPGNGPDLCSFGVFPTFGAW